MHRLVKYMNTDVHIYEQEPNEKPRLLQHERLLPLSLIRDDNGKLPKAIINASYFTSKYTIGRDQGDLRNDTCGDKDNGKFCDLVFTKDGQYHFGKYNNWDYKENVVAGLSLATFLVKDGQPAQDTSPFGADRLVAIRPQTAIGILQDGKILLIVAEGDGNGDRGINGYELRTLIMREYPTIKFLGQCDGGGSSEMIVNGKITNRLSEGRERAMWNGFALIEKETIEKPEAPSEQKPSNDLKVVEMLVSKDNYKNKCPYQMTPTRIVVHNTDNDASAKNEVAYMIRNKNQVSFHFAVDDKEVVQGIPTDRNTWNAGDGANGTGNREGISVEICYSLSGGDRFIKAEQNAAKFIAKLLKEYNWGIEQVTRHKDYNGKNCPKRTMEMGWDRFLDMIKKEMDLKEPKPEAPSEIEELKKQVMSLTNQLVEANKQKEKLEIENLKLENALSMTNEKLDQIKQIVK